MIKQGFDDANITLLTQLAMNQIQALREKSYQSVSLHAVAGVRRRFTRPAKFKSIQIRFYCGKTWISLRHGLTLINESAYNHR
jgi:hypothetical protein